ncbi:MAG: trypsin-like serine protease, partial [Bdellovibrionota bacterium]
DGSTVELEGKYIRNHPNSKLVNGNPANGYDLMIIRLSQDAPEAMKPFDLNNENLTEGTQVTVAGFGETATDRADSDVLRWVDLPMTVFENSSYISDGKHELEAKLKDGLDTYAEIHAKGIMLFVTDGKKGLCMGDSGGPGYVLKNGRYQLVEVFSSMLAESASNMCEYGLYAGENVKFHGDWIKQTIDELNALK